METSLGIIAPSEVFLFSYEVPAVDISGLYESCGMEISEMESGCCSLEKGGYEINPQYLRRV